MLPEPPAPARLEDRVDEGGRASFLRLAAESGAAFGAVIGLFSALALQANGAPWIVSAAWVVAIAVATGAPFGLLFAVAMRLFAALAGRKLYAARQRTRARVAGVPPHQVHALVVTALAEAGARARRADLAGGTASVVLDRGAWIDAGRTEVFAAVEPDGAGGSRVTLETGRTRAPRYDFGARRNGIDRLYARLDALLAAAPPWLAQRVPAVALPGEVRVALARVGLLAAVSSLEPDVPGWSAESLARDGSTRSAVVVRVGAAVSDATAVDTARAAGAARAGDAVGGAGFVLVPVTAEEDAAAVARRVHDAWVASGHAAGYRGGVRVQPGEQGDARDRDEHVHDASDRAPRSSAKRA